MTRHSERGPHRNAKGVCLLRRLNCNPEWVAYWQEHRKQKFKRFSFGRGRSSGEAYQLAKEWREKMIALPRQQPGPPRGGYSQPLEPDPRGVL